MGMRLLPLKPIYHYQTEHAIPDAIAFVVTSCTKQTEHLQKIRDIILPLFRHKFVKEYRSNKQYHNTEQPQSAEDKSKEHTQVQLIIRT
jgi:hypothetical protein